MLWDGHDFAARSCCKGDEQKISRDRNCKRSRQNCRQQGNILTISVGKHFCIEIIYSLSKISHFQLFIGV